HFVGSACCARALLDAQKNAVFFGFFVIASVLQLEDERTQIVGVAFAFSFALAPDFALCQDVGNGSIDLVVAQLIRFSVDQNGVICADEQTLQRGRVKGQLLDAVQRDTRRQLGNDPLTYLVDGQ